MEVIHLPQRSEVVKTTSTLGTNTNLLFQQLQTVFITPSTLVTVRRITSHCIPLSMAHPSDKMVSLSHYLFSLTTVTLNDKVHDSRVSISLLTLAQDDILSVAICDVMYIG